MFEERRDSPDPRLVESEERYRAVIENASDMIQSVRPDGSFEFVNPAWLEKLGYTAQEVDDLVIWDVIHPESFEHCREFFMIVMQGQSIDDVRLTFMTKGGEPIPAEGSVTVRMTGGEVIASHAFFRDISERLQAEALRDRNEQLERERLAQYYEKMAALGKLSAGLAHELNNPASAARRASAELTESLTRLDTATRELASAGLTSDNWQVLTDVVEANQGRATGPEYDDPIAISEMEDAVADWLGDHGIEQGWDLAPGLVAGGVEDSTLERLSDQIPPAALNASIRWLAESMTVHRAVDVVCRSASRMSDLVTAVKAYSHMDRATEQIIDVHDGINNTLIILAHRLRGMTVVTDFDRSLPPVLAHGSGLNQVWTNIIDNAVDATSGRGTITIRTRQGGDRILVEVEDDGCGIPAEHLTRIFEPFYTTKPQGSGSGLGLDTAWRIVTEEHSGTIEVDSVPGKTVFRVHLPTSATATGTRTSTQPAIA